LSRHSIENPAAGQAAHLATAEFRKACGRFATGIAIAAVADAAGHPHGLTVNSFSSVSLEPPLVLICLALKASVLAHFENSNTFSINILTADQETLSSRFARSGEHRFSGISWHPGPAGSPVLGDALAWMECTVSKRIPAGDHVIYLGQVVAVGCREGQPLVYYSSAYAHLA
jgi:flavin reductase (DIM6/NTAB) family NADH-FMN oxidoreductase RutF